MQELIKVEVNDNQEPIVSARELHKALEVKKRFSAWQGFAKEVNCNESENIKIKRRNEIWQDQKNKQKKL